MKTTTSLTLLLLLRIFSSTASGVTIDWVTVGDPGNAGELSGLGAGGYGSDVIVGSVDYTYRISKYEVTAGQYTDFLNAVADSDPNGLYNTNMWSLTYGCKIKRTGTAGNYDYTVAGDRANRPVNYVSFFDAMRFTNWLENGQPTGAQGPGTTEAGVYTIGDGVSEVRASGATFFLPSEDEWYKAAYYKGGDTDAGYWDYPTQSDSMPSNDLVAPDLGNNANFYQSGYTIGVPFWMTEVGEFENSESAYGTFDQGGNVLEWNEALLYNSVRGVRGDSFSFRYTNMLAAAYRSSLYPAEGGHGIGFRVASIPEPASITLIVCLGVLVMLLRRRLR